MWVVLKCKEKRNKKSTQDWETEQKNPYLMTGAASKQMQKKSYTQTETQYLLLYLHLSSEPEFLQKVVRERWPNKLGQRDFWTQKSLGTSCRANCCRKKKRRAKKHPTHPLTNRSELWHQSTCWYFLVTNPAEIGTPNITMLACSHKQEEGSSLIPKMDLTIKQQHSNNTWSTFLQNVGIEWKTGYPLFPGSSLPPLLTKRAKPANIQTMEKHPKFIFSQKNMGRKGGRCIKKIV